MTMRTMQTKMRTMQTKMRMTGSSCRHASSGQPNRSKPKTRRISRLGLCTGQPGFWTTCFVTSRNCPDLRRTCHRPSGSSHSLRKTCLCRHAGCLGWYGTCHRPSVSCPGANRSCPDLCKTCHRPSENCLGANKHYPAQHMICLCRHAGFLAPRSICLVCPNRQQAPPPGFSRALSVRQRAWSPVSPQNRHPHLQRGAQASVRQRQNSSWLSRAHLELPE